MPKAAERGLAWWAENAENADMRFFAAEAFARGMTLRGLARLIERDHAAVVRHMMAKQTSQKTIGLYEGRLELGDHTSRAHRGPQALTEQDLAYWQKRLLRGVAYSEQYADFTDATDRITKVLRSCKPSTRREILHGFATTHDQAAAVESLCRLAGMSPFVRVKRSSGDSEFWAIADSLRTLGLKPSERAAVLDDLRDRLGRDSAIVRANDAYLFGSPFGALVTEDNSDRKAAALDLAKDGDS